MPHEGKSGRSILYDLPKCIAWRREEDRKEAEDLRHPKTFEEARTRKMAAEAELAELDVMERRAEVGIVEKMEAVVTNGVDRLRDSVRSLPTKHAPNLVNLRNVTAAKNALRGFMTELFDAFHRRG